MPEIDQEKARKEYEAIVASRIFDRAPNLGILLRYVCEKAFEQKADEIKEYNIAVEAFGRRADFDKRRDSIVRVEAHRLRKRLQQYYDDEDGARHELRIEIPSGGYAPIFVVNTPKVEAVPESWPAPEPPPPAEAPPVGSTAPPARRWPLLWLGVTAVVIAGITGFRYFPHQGGARLAITQTAAAAARVSSLPAPGGAANTIRIMAGSSVNGYTDSSGAVWDGDRYFTGGIARAVQFRSIARTKDPTIFLKYREGDFQYDIPLNPGVYEIRLLFAETNYGEANVDGGGETSRL